MQNPLSGFLCCQVCQMSMPSCQIRYGANVCEACKKFFARNWCKHWRKKLICSSGNFNCPVSFERVIFARNGSALRYICSYCRMQKCEAVGMRLRTEPLQKSRTFKRRSNSDSNIKKCNSAPSPRSDNSDEVSLMRNRDSQAASSDVPYYPSSTSGSARQSFQSSTSTTAAGNDNAVAETTPEEHQLLTALLQLRDHPNIANDQDRLQVVASEIRSIYELARTAKTQAGARMRVIRLNAIVHFIETSCHRQSYCQ